MTIGFSTRYSSRTAAAAYTLVKKRLTFTFILVIMVMSSSPATSFSSLATPTTQGALQIPRTLQSTDLVSSLAWYQVTFATSTAGAIDKIKMVFPAGTDTIAAGVIERVGIGSGTLLKDAVDVNEITFDVTTPVSIPAGTFIRLEMVGIKNPFFPSTTFTATITTMDSAGNQIDGPSTTNVYTMRRVGNNDIASNAVTTPKIADNSITSTKPAESFMKKVTLLDSAAGNAKGWNPGGARDRFTISEPMVTGFDTFISIVVFTGELYNDCQVTNFGGSSFRIICENSPGEGAILDYVVGNLPQHVS